jgi:1,4-dihydroxy-2-naphthoate octaprenyltransferase
MLAAVIPVANNLRETLKPAPPPKNTHAPIRLDDRGARAFFVTLMLGPVAFVPAVARAVSWPLLALAALP